MSKKVSNLRETCHNLLVLVTTVVVIIWLSIFCYGTFYYFYIPPVTHVKPVYFQFETSCHASICSFPTANVSLTQKNYDQLLTRGQHYRITLDLDMPESAKNRQLGMFMVKLSLFSQEGLLLKSSFRTGLLHYKSNLLRYLNTLVYSPFLLAGSWEEKQVVTVLLFENYMDHPDFPAIVAKVELHSRTIEVYSAVLRVHAHFSGLRYYMYYWPVFSALVGVSTNFYFLTLLALFSWYRFLQWQRDIEFEDTYFVESANSAAYDEPFSPVPVDLTSSEPSDNKDSPVRSESPPENRKSKEDLSRRLHSSVQDLFHRKKKKAVSVEPESFSRVEEPTGAGDGQSQRQRRKSESF